jgi:hypothetical protein
MSTSNIPQKWSRILSNISLFKIFLFRAGSQWLMSVILVTQEAEIISWFKSSLGK